MTQAWGWLVAAVLAAGLNASYHNGGLQWAHQAVDQITGQVEHSSAAVLALASGNSARFLYEARLLTARNETASCPLTSQLARVQTEFQADFQTQFQPMLESMFENKLARSQAEIDLWSARDEAQRARREAQRERLEARITAQIDSQTSHLRISTANFAPAAVALRAIPARVACPRIRVNVPRMPAIKMPVSPEIHIDLAGNGPV